MRHPTRDIRNSAGESDTDAGFADSDDENAADELDE